MKKILLIVGAVIVAIALVTVFVYKQQSGYTKVLTAKIHKQDLATVVSGTGQIKPKTIVNVGANVMGRVTHFYVKEGDTVKKGQIVATIENVQQRANVAGQEAAISAAKTDINSYIAAEKTAEANVDRAKADLEQKKLDWDRAQSLFKAGIMARQDFDSKKAAYDTDVATVAQMQAQLNQAKAQTESARGHLQTQVATLRANQDMLEKTIAIAPFDGIVTNMPVKEGETVVTGIQNTAGSTLMTLADMSVITAEVKVDETDIVNIKDGQPADVTVDAIPGKVFKGHVTLVGDQALLRSTGIATSQSTTGTEEAKDFKVVVTLDQTPNNHLDELRPGLSTTAKITTSEKPDTLTIPIQALVQRDPAIEKTLLANNGKPPDTPSDAPPPDTNAAQSQFTQGVYIVFNDNGTLRAKFVPVTTGVTGATDIEVLTGLSQGQEIVTGRYQVLRALKSGQHIKRDNGTDTTDSSSSSSSS